MAIAVVLNNYLHDLATGVFFGCALAMWGIAAAARAKPDSVDSLAPIHAALTRGLWGSLAWILIGGIPRIVFFPRYEFIPALGKGIVVALALKHVVMLAAVLAGLFMWRRASRLMRAATTGTPAGR